MFNSVNVFLKYIQKFNLQVAIENDIPVLKVIGENKNANTTPESAELKVFQDFLEKNKAKILAVLTGKPIRKNPKDIIRLYRMSGMQEGIMFHTLFDDDSFAYKEQFVADVNAIDTEGFLRAWDYVIQKHSIFRTAFFYDQLKIPVQGVYADAELPFTEFDLSHLTGKALKSAIQEIELAERKTRFNLNYPPLMRVTLVKTGKNSNRLIWTWHHILLDGWSMPIVIEELLNTYQHIISGKALPPISEDKFEDFIRYSEHINKAEAENHWKKYISGFQKPSFLPFISNAANRTKGIGDYKLIGFTLNETLNKYVQTYAQQNRITINTLMQGVWARLLHFYTGSNDVVFGAIVSGRPDDLPDVEQKVGLFINSLPVRSVLDTSKPVSTWLQELQQSQVLSRQFQNTQLKDIQGFTSIQGDLFDHLFVFENYPVSSILSTNDWALKLSNYEIHDQSNYPLSVIIYGAQSITVEFLFNSNLLSESVVNAMRGHFEKVLELFITHEVLTDADFKILSKEERNLVTKSFNNNATEFPQEPVHAIFEAYAKNKSSRTALVFEGTSTSYGDLNAASNRFAHFLIEKGVTAEMLVPLCLERSSDMMVCILGILKVGAAYVPLDTEYPEQRLRYMLEDTKAQLTIATKTTVDKLPKMEGKTVIVWEDIKEGLKQYSSENPNVDVKPENLAYVMYTSGSTGTPKGVMVEHRNVVSLVRGVEFIKLTEDDVLLSTGSPSFDATTIEYWGMLLNGGKLVLCSEDRLLNMDYLAEEMKHNKVSKMWFTSSWLNHLVDGDITLFEGLKTVMAGGEKLSESHIEKLRATYPEMEIINGYGPTENTTFSLTYRIVETEFKASIPIGKPLNNRTAYILDQFNQPVPVGISGEICVGGAGLSRGYLNNETLTKEKFITNPFDNNDRLYRTGDLGRWLDNGNIEYLGRMDEQVKIRGFRIEPGEIEMAILQTKLVKQAVVTTGSNKQLIAYVVANNGFDKDSLIQILINQLPEYMVPQIWVTLDNLPLTPNGKVDKSALPAPDMDKLMEGQYAAPRNLTEEKLVQIWEQLLEIEQVGIYDNFFQLGGHSLLAIRLISAVRKEFNAEMPIDYIFDNPTIATLAPKLVVKPKSELLPALVKQQHFGKIPLSFSQERLWFIDQLEGSVQYHIPEILEIKGDLNVDALISSLHLIVKKHQVLRTIIIQDKADAYQEVLDVKDWKVDVLDIRNLPNAKDRLDETIFSFINSPFNLSKDFVFRAKLIHVSDDLYKLAIVVHHIAFDGWSISVIVRDLVNFYSALVKGQQPEFSSDEVQYADFALWQRKYLTRDILDKKLQYWTKKLEGITPLELPTDFARPAIQNSEGALYDFKLEQELVAGLERINRETGTTLFMVLLAAYKVFLYRYTSQEDLSVGTAVAGRQQKALEQMVGFFVNTLVIRSIVNPNQTFSAFLEEVKRNTLEAFENQELPFEKLVETVVKERDLSRTPLFQTMLVLQNTPEMPELKLGKAKITSDDFEISTSKFDFSMELMPTQNGSLNGRVEYSTEVFELNTIQTMTRHFINILHALVNNTNQKVGKLNMLDDKEIKQAISEFKPEIIPVLPEQTIVNLFEKQVVNTPNAVALELAGAEMTYQNLNTLSNRVSNFILQKGLKADQLVGICMQRSLEMVVAMMGVLKSGAAYVPVDDNYPDDRIGEIIEDTGATIILSDTSNKSRLTALSNSLVVDIQELISDNSGLPAENPSLKIDEKSLAYVMYTSGSTGKPKGVMIERKSMMSYVFRYAEFCNLQPEDCVLQHTTLSFDTSVEEIFPALITGASVAIVKEGGKDIPYIIDYIEKGKVTIISSTPLMVEAINNDLNSIGKLRFLICGGDVLNPSAIDKLFGKVKIGNGYGPTETTVAITLYETAGISDASSIGGPLPNTHVYIMDKNENPLPARIPGEIWIGGVQIARGYLNQRELTDSKFVKDPFINDDQARVYKTGDLARFKKDGTLEFLGRIDEQLKIRGYRVEPEEIENAIVQSKLVSQCVVIGKRDNDGINRLIAYVVAPNEFDQLAIMRFLKLHLPEYMVPQIWVKLDALPINTNGKIDKKLLPEPDISKLLESTYVAPVDDIEKQLVEIWKTQLGIEKIGTNDNFFQIGGHSILATKVVSQINNTFSINLPIRSIFEFTTIKELAAYIKLLILPTQNVSKSESFTL